MSLRNVRGSARNEPASNIGMWSPNSAKLYKKNKRNVELLKILWFCVISDKSESMEIEITNTCELFSLLVHCFNWLRRTSTLVNADQ